MHHSTDATSSRRNRVIIHALFWLLVFHLLFDLTGIFYYVMDLFDPEEPVFDGAFLFVLLLPSFFYWNLFYLIPRFLNREGWWKYLLYLMIGHFAAMFAGILLIQVLERIGYWVEGVDAQSFWEGHLIFNLIGIGVSTSIGLFEKTLQKTALQKAAEEKQKEAELKYLNAQFHPHFLFNTLNGIYALAAEEEALQTQEAILKLSEVMRYPLKEGSEKRISLEKEIRFLEDYIALQKLRLGEEYPVHFKVSGAVEDWQIAPLLFIPFVENAFKYGLSRRQVSPIEIQLHTSESRLEFTVLNSIVKEENVSSQKIGLTNVSSRLDLLYPGQYELNAWDKEGTFIVELALNKGG